ncbi:MAG TPA: hypothetical protein VMT00_04455 [Thermoanaerobaculia bacterium]|nr:hypothetical protein [Thermoanaerobaculia bacterium]
MSTTERGYGGKRLLDLVRAELVNIPIEQWEFFFPVQVAVWRFISERRPGVLGELDAGFSNAPFFRGKGAEWFCGELGGDRRYGELLERIMYPVVDGLPRSAYARGFVVQPELSALDENAIRELEQLVIRQVDALSG